MQDGRTRGGNPFPKFFPHRPRNFLVGGGLVDGVRARATHQLKPQDKNMKTKSLIVIAASLGLIGAASAEGEKPRGEHRKLPPEIIAKFDKDGDGKLNDEERAAARSAREGMMEARKKEMLEKFDTDKDGTLDDTEKAAMHEARKKMMLEKFDANKDGTLDDTEKAAMRKEMGDRPGGPRGPRGEGGKGGKGKQGGDAEAPGTVGR